MTKKSCQCSCGDSLYKTNKTSWTYSISTIISNQSLGNRLIIEKADCTMYIKDMFRGLVIVQVAMSIFIYLAYYDIGQNFMDIQ